MSLMHRIIRITSFAKRKSLASFLMCISFLFFFPFFSCVIGLVRTLSTVLGKSVEIAHLPFSFPWFLWQCFENFSFYMKLTTVLWNLVFLILKYDVYITRVFMILSWINIRFVKCILWTYLKWSFNFYLCPLIYWITVTIWHIFKNQNKKIPGPTTISLDLVCYLNI